ncbi:MAG: DUF3810 family protein [Acidobacteriota bacterium]
MSKSTVEELKPAKARRFVFRKEQLSAKTILKIAVVMVAILLTVFQLPVAFVDRVYANGFYPRLQSFVTPVTNLLPFAIYDLLIVAVIFGAPAWWMVRLVKAGKGRRLKTAARLLINTMVFAAVIFLLFQLLWGFNYARQPLSQKLDYHDDRINKDAALRLARLCIEQANAEVDKAHQTAFPDDREWLRRLQPSYDALLKALGRTSNLTLAKPKATLFDKYLESTGISGFLNPFGFETIVARGFHPLDRAFTLAHEWGHLAGYATESEASFIGLLALLRSEDAACRYAGWLALYSHIPLQRILNDADEATRQALPKFSPQVEADLLAMAEEENKRQINEQISKAQWEMYQQFLKANNATPNYGEVISLMMGTTFEEGWTPVFNR